MVEAAPAIVHFPAGDGLRCPVCDSTQIVGTVDRITGVALTSDDYTEPGSTPDSPWYIGSTDVDWDSQQTVVTGDGDPLVQCTGYHWYFAIGYHVEPDGIASASNAEVR